MSDRVGHVVDPSLPGNDVIDAMTYGTEVVAICGARFVPSTIGGTTCPACDLMLESDNQEG